MKNLWSLLLLAGLFITSCTNDDEVMLIDMEGTYIGLMECVDPDGENDNETITVVLEETEEGSGRFYVIMEDDVTFTGTREGNDLILAIQTINEEADFDVVTIEGTFSWTEEGKVNFDATYSVDDEGEYDCVSTLIKQ